MSVYPITFPYGINHPSVENVLSIAKEITEEGRVLNIDYLYKRVKYELKLPRSAILSIIQYLLNEKVIVDGSKYTKNSVLNNRFRALLYFFIKNNLCAHFSSVKRFALNLTQSKNVSVGRIIWHLEMLIRFNHIKKLKIQNYSIFLPVEIEDEFGIIYFFLHEKINFKIIEIFIKKRKIRRSEIYKYIGEKRENTYYRINILIEHQILEFSDKKNNLICIHSPKKSKIIDAFNEMKNLNKESKRINKLLLLIPKK